MFNSVRPAQNVVGIWLSLAPQARAKGLEGGLAWETPGGWWECPFCASQAEIGQDVEAQLEGRPRLL